ncbi:hypothetical protein HMPREF1544_05918 [Mucor circinelloides 1006PhL]|uniref:C2H2-type domain-containing protein n=1 Tax=Mucor circinelloides f. circinelloides (strain 1006PhL) TaxID=1220926 RepID=S2JFP0_MUCC1|nr:hypothetical protein HMPREF1544_05918 [Mucor circinelloides 1006PhL]
MYNQHVNPCYYGVNNELLAETSNQAQNQPFVATNNAYPCVSTTSHAQQILSSPPFEQQAEVGWYNQETSYYQQQPQLGHDFNALSCSFGHNDLTSPQELVLFNLLQDRQQQQPHICYQKNQLIQHDEQDSSLNEWALANANQVDICAIKHSNGLLPLSPMSMQSADNFDSSPIMGGASFSHRMYPQTNPSLPSHLSPSPLLSAATQGHYHHHQLIFNNCHPDMFASEAVANKSIQLQEIAQMQYQQQQEQVYQIKEIKQEDYSTFDKQQQQQQQQQPKQCKKTTRRRASRSQLQCTTCFKTFSRPYNLKSHQRTHTKERPFQCLHPDCGWTFARPHDLKRHELLHSGIKPFACVCGKRFARSDAYKRHQSVDINCAISTMPQPRKRQPTSSNTTKNNTL